MGKCELFYMFMLLASWTVDLHHWHEWGVLDEKYGTEAVSREEVRVPLVSQWVTAIMVAVRKLRSLVRKIFLN